MKIILASASPARQKILKNLGIKFEVVVSDFAEKNPANLSARELVQYLAKNKAQIVYKKFIQENEVLVLGFDSVVEFKGEIIGKIKTKKHALEIFQQYRGQEVKLYTGISIIGHLKSKKQNACGKNVEKTSYEISSLHFKAATTNCQLRDFLSYNDWQGKAGGIAVEGASSFLIEKIEGDWNNILGLPVLKMNEIIQELTDKPAIKVFEKAENL